MARSFILPGSSRRYMPEKQYRTGHIKVELRVDPEAKSIAGSCTARIIPVAEGLASVRFDACEMSISAASIDGSQVRFEHDGKELVLFSERPLSSGEHVTQVEYSAEPKHGVYFVHPDAAYPDKPTQVWTQYESVAARFCFPCHDHPDDKSTTEMLITAPDGYQVISTGKLISRRSEEGWTTHHWSESAPHSTYLNSFVVGKFVELKGETMGVPLAYYVPEEKSKDASRLFGQTPEMMRVFAELTGYKFPYEKYAQVCVHDYIYGGMENISATTLVDTRFPDERSEEDFAARYSRPDRNHIELVAHELAHSWFGDLVTLKDWPHAWLNEGFATYMEALYHEQKYGKDEFRQNMWFKAQTYFEEDEKRYRRRIVENDYLYPDDLFDSVAYEKAAWMIHQLRHMLGDEPFFKGLREYVARFAYKNADTHDFMRSMEESTGASLERYFEQSFFWGGHAELEVEYRWESSSRSALVTVKQVQKADELTPVFELPAEIVFYTMKGRTVKRVWLRSPEERYGFELDSEPSIAEFDPEGWLLKKLVFRKSRTMLLSQLESSADASSRRDAAESLSSFGDSEVIEKLREAVEREQYWSVRAQAATSLGKIGGERALETLLGLRGVGHRRVRRAVIAALGSFKGDARVQAALRDSLFRDESPYNQCEAALSLAKSGDLDIIATLREAMQLPSPEYGLTEACLEALGETKIEDARVILRSNLPYGKPTRVRVGALKGYQKLGTLHEEDVKLLQDIAVGDDDYVVRGQLLMILAEIKDRRFLGTLRRVAAEDADNRNRRRAAEIIIELEAFAEEGAVAELRREVEKLRKDNQEIRDKLSVLERGGA